MSVCLDRFSQGLPDTQQQGVFAHCEGCGREIYFGEDYYEVPTDKGYIKCHKAHDCLEKVTMAEVATAGE